MTRMLAGLAALILAVGSGLPAAAALTPAGTYAYRVDHPDHGEIGTYTNSIVRNGDAVSVDTKIRIAVKIAFVTVYRLEADRHEEWRDGRLVAYSSVTRRNGETAKIEGRAEGDKFVIQGPRGTVTAPADVWPANPWSSRIVEAGAVIGAMSGKLYPARVTEANQATITVEGRPLPVQHYAVVMNDPHELWYDAAGRLVKFTTEDDGEVITFTLK